MAVERSCALTAVAFSERRRDGVRLTTGPHRGFGLSPGRRMVNVPYPPLSADWERSTLTCGVALQCSPSKDRIAEYDLHELDARQLGALSLVEGGVAAGWIAETLPGLVPEIRRRVPNLEIGDHTLDGGEIIDRALSLARSHTPIDGHPVLGALPLRAPARGALSSAVRRAYGRMPWTSSRTDAKRLMSVPVGGDGGARNSNLPPPSKPENEEIEIRPDQRAGIPYPEWNMWRGTFLPDHVAVLERRHPTRNSPVTAVSPDIRRWFAEHTHRTMRSGLEDGSDLDLDRYVTHHLDTLTGTPSQPRLFRDLVPSARDVSTALLLDGSSSLSTNGGRAFRIELACADALSRAMTLSRERHGIFVFSGNTRHRVEVNCLKDFTDPHFVDPSSLGLRAGGYTRLGAPIRHLTRRLLDQASERRLLIVIGDGLMSDEGYEGRYAWADVAHALDEADEAGVSVYYVGIGPVRVDPLPEVFGERRSRRIRHVDDLPQVLAHIHRELVSA
ncbi:nitric oxide reductase activation protein NorD [Rhodococcus gannanensis]|uniref:Nitric oxide reductase activation protein NorD n=1 Tax=Rhodococcus gannanensis TaxID=1960308 RepID=A0ABW4PC24_9NOCA